MRIPSEGRQPSDRVDSFGPHQELAKDVKNFKLPTSSFQEVGDHVAQLEEQLETIINGPMPIDTDKLNQLKNFVRKISKEIDSCTDPKMTDNIKKVLSQVIWTQLGTTELNDINTPTAGGNWNPKAFGHLIHDIEELKIGLRMMDDHEMANLSLQEVDATASCHVLNSLNQIVQIFNEKAKVKGYSSDFVKKIGDGFQILVGTTYQTISDWVSNNFPDKVRDLKPLQNLTRFIYDSKLSFPLSQENMNKIKELAHSTLIVNQYFRI